MAEPETQETIKVVFPDGVEEVGKNLPIPDTLRELARNRGLRKIRVFVMGVEMYPDEIPADAQEITVQPYDAPGR